MSHCNFIFFSQSLCCFFIIFQVAICAGCNVVYPWGAAVIGTVAGMAYIAWSSAMVALKVDDPLDAVAGKVSSYETHAQILRV